MATGMRAWHSGVQTVEQSKQNTTCARTSVSHPAGKCSCSTEYPYRNHWTVRQERPCVVRSNSCADVEQSMRARAGGWPAAGGGHRLLRTHAHNNQSHVLSDLVWLNRLDLVLSSAERSRLWIEFEQGTSRRRRSRAGRLVEVIEGHPASLGANPAHVCARGSTGSLKHAFSTIPCPPQPAGLEGPGSRRN